MSTIGGTNPENTASGASEVTAANEALDKQHLEEFQRELAAMLNALENRLPGLAQQNLKINNLLRQYPETVALLTPEEIGSMMRGVIQESKVQFTLANIGGRSGAKKDLIKQINSSGFDPSKISF